MKQFKLFTILALVISALALTGCYKVLNDGSSPIEDQYFKVENSSFKKGQFPVPSVSQSVGSLNINRSAIPGGSSYVTINTSVPMQEFYLGVDGVDGYLVVPATSTYSSSVSNLYNLLLLISQNLHQNFTFRISGRSTSGEILYADTVNISYVQVGTGALQISLSFNNNTDVDLYVVRPTGEVIFYGNLGGIDANNVRWGLDLDSNADCEIDGINNENVYFTDNQLINGKYQVWVNLFMNCNQIATNWAVVATRDGSLITPSFGQNPSTGIFPADAPSNPIDSNLNGQAVKVMEFTVTGGVDASNISSYARVPVLSSAILKKQIASKLQ